MKVGWFLSMQIPSVPQRIDFKTYSGFTDGVLWAEHHPCPICPGRVDDRYEAAERMCRIMEVNLMDDERLARSPTE